MKKEHVKLTEVDRAFLEPLTRKGELKARAYRRALGLLELDRGKSFTEVAETLQVSIPSLSRWATQYRERGLQVIQDQPRSGRPMVIDGQQRAKITALACREAYALADRFEFYFTPKAASWLNMIEMEFSALSRLCLNRRMPTLALLEKEILTLLSQRDAAQIKIHWQFSIQSARSKLNSHYVKVQPDNQKFKET